MAGNGEMVQHLLQGVAKGKIRSLARAITVLESGDPGGLMGKALFAGESLPREALGARVVGITGPPGVGKSSLVDCVIAAFREMGHKVAVIAIDPSSPFSGGAILGDRIRMQRHSTDRGVFIRSMGTRGHLGGLAAAVPAAVELAAMAGFPWIIVETVGIGQSEVEIMGLADTTVVVEAPGLGDDIQAIKAGVMEIGDVFAVNKADRPGADRTVLEIEANLDLAMGMYRPKVLRCVARSNDGIAELVQAITDHMDYLASGPVGSQRRARRYRNWLSAMLYQRLQQGVDLFLEHQPELNELYQASARGEKSPGAACDAIVEAIFGPGV
ncbi:MAG: methylmalonyl Co-A mutase-associated GTPase MeaB [Candidatus Wallbacteria bacterium HGW-Wallbacteria-1]|jgi:LAO/AO transport system kinase|uniref:Methylmalonyl Co-A mutase-associated GTPase MeaB n=1 Tax=Candidatus Wallbacteria bacterium HGW-Wallbacteria-1 TaxID=2013854 RepID=A0A2N1PJ66_9BACT|nr:MAG: methylmalonyl Co-A mutase-associated GTPase MeaB [Candidatus Wallbacteria bacterium HGW-Wallbacteria-1]